MIFQKLKKDLVRASKTRREVIAKNYGFSSVDNYLNFLNDKIKENEKTNEKENERLVSNSSSELVTIYKVNLVDTSTSMTGSKIKAVNLALSEEFKLLQTQNVNYVYSLIQFSSSKDISYIFKNISVNNLLPQFNLYADGCTALYDAIGFVIKEFKNTTEKVLVNVYTDGQDNDSSTFSPENIKALLSTFNNITLTFVVTKEDANRIKSNLNIDDSNILIHDNTAESLKKSVIETANATLSFSDKVSKGEDVKRGFYKKLSK